MITRSTRVTRCIGHRVTLTVPKRTRRSGSGSTISFRLLYQHLLRDNMTCASYKVGRQANTATSPQLCSTLHPRLLPHFRLLLRRHPHPRRPPSHSPLWLHPRLRRGVRLPRRRAPRPPPRRTRRPPPRPPPRRAPRPQRLQRFQRSPLHFRHCPPQPAPLGPPRSHLGGPNPSPRTLELQ